MFTKSQLEKLLEACEISASSYDQQMNEILYIADQIDGAATEIVFSSVFQRSEDARKTALTYKNRIQEIDNLSNYIKMLLTLSK
jgi:hypothetical protein